jgi:hypothetical protein
VKSARRGGGYSAMKRLPYKSDPVVVRTDFSNQRVWSSIKRSILGGRDEDHEAAVSFVDDPQYDGAIKKQVMSAVPKDHEHTFIMIVDSISVMERSHPVLIVSLRKPYLEFRAVPKAIDSIAVNLAIGNLGFDDFIREADAGGVFRGF